MALAIALGISMLPVIIWAFREYRDQKLKEKKRQYEKPFTLF